MSDDVELPPLCIECLRPTSGPINGGYRCYHCYPPEPPPPKLDPEAIDYDDAPLIPALVIGLILAAAVSIPLVCAIAADTAPQPDLAEHVVHYKAAR